MPALKYIFLLTTLMQQIYLQRPTKSPVCPPLIGDLSPPGCNKTFIVDIDGKIPCKSLSDCPMSWDWWEDGQDEEWATGTFANCGGSPVPEDRYCFFSTARNGYFAPCFNEDDNMIVLDRSGYTNPYGEYECHVNEDCGWKEELEMKCENNRCISRNRWLWTNIDWEDREEKSAKYRDFEGKKVYRCSDARRDLGGTVEFSRGTPSFSIVSQSSSNRDQSIKAAACKECTQTPCPPDKPCLRRNGKCRKPACNKRSGKCWCPKYPNPRPRS